MRTFRSRIVLVPAAGMAGRVALMLIALVFTTTKLQAQSSFYKPLTLAQAKEDTSEAKDASLPQGILAGASMPQPGSVHEETVNAHLQSGTPHELSADDTARQLANPNNPLASLTLKNQLRWYKGDLPGADDQFNYTALFQPVFPFTLPDGPGGGKANLFVRPAFPFVVDQPVFDADNGQFKSASGLGDIGFDLAYGISSPSGFQWALGMVGTLPTATDSGFAGKQLRLGPEALLARFEKWGVYGIFPSHQWNVAGWSDKYYANTQIQAIFTILPGGGWNVGTAPIMNYDWALKEWSIPINLSISRTVKVGKTPVKLALDLNYYVERYNSFGAEWMVGFNITPVVPNVLNNWLHPKMNASAN